MLRGAVVASLLAVGCKNAELTPCTRGATFEVRVVDHDSAYMKTVFAHVGSDRGGQPTEPGALEAGIRADVDQWMHDRVTTDGLPTGMTQYTDYYLIAYDRAALDRYLAALEPPPADREIRIEHIVPLPDARDTRPQWRTYLVEKTPMLTTDAIGRARAGSNPAMNGAIAGGPIVTIELTPAGRAAFAKGTAAAVGRKVATILDGEIVNAPIIEEPITGGRLALTMRSVALANEAATKLGCVK
jgi:hypothetical protein